MKQRKLLLGLFLAIVASASAGTVRMKTNKAVGESLTFVVNAGVQLKLTWGSGDSDEITSTGLPQTVEIKDASLQMTSENDIKSLYLADNELTELNVSGISSSLRTLCCANNQLKTLSLSGCTSLVALDCQGNQLTTLSVPSSKMEDLNIANNQLSTIGLSSTGNLVSMVCANNKISNLNSLSNMTKLTALFCQGNQISTLSLTRNANLKHLIASDNKIRTITFIPTSQSSADPGLKTLEDLWVSNNSLTTIDISDQTALVGLVVANNNLTSVNWYPYSNTAARNKFKYLDFSNNMLSFNSFPNIYSTLTNNYTLDGNVAPQKQFKLLGDMQTNQPTGDDFKKLIERSAWNTLTKANVKLVDQNGTELQADVDYKFSNYALTFLTYPHDGVVLTLTSANYPGLEIQSLPFNVSPDPTGIETVETTADELNENTRVYDLQGRQMNAASMKKGIYIVNGKKIIIR